MLLDESELFEFDYPEITKGGHPLLSWSYMKKGDIFTCEEYGLELQAIRECTDFEAAGVRELVKKS